MAHWKTLLKKSITAPQHLAGEFPLDTASLEEVARTYPMRINPYYLSLIRHPGDPFWRQAVPDTREIEDAVCQEDPLDEENLSPVPNLVHKYPDRAENPR